MSRSLFDSKIMPLTDKMYRYAYSILKEKESAHDVVQECLVKIWKNRMKLKQIKNTDAWVMRITRNQCYDWVKVNRYHLQSDRDILRDDLTLQESGATDAALLTKDRMAWLAQVIDSLPEKQKEIYHLREVEEMTYQDIAEVLSLSLSEVKVTIHRTRKLIREQINKIDGYGLAN
jgi:RNA polymerase sigma factor (sigma-70 family)